MNYTPAVTPGRLRDLCCPKRWHDLHVSRVSGPPFVPNSASSYGNIVHLAAKIHKDPQVRAAMRPGIEKAVQIASGTLNPGNLFSDLDSSQAMASLTRYFESADVEETTLAVEVLGEFRSGGILYRAQYDRLAIRDSDPNTLIIPDLKTTKIHRIDLESACLMLAIAKVNLPRWREEYGHQFTTVQLRYDFLGPTGLEESQEITAECVRDLWPGLVSKAKHIVLAADPTAKIAGEHCMWCPQRATCLPPVEITETDLAGLLG